MYRRSKVREGLKTKTSYSLKVKVLGLVGWTHIGWFDIHSIMISKISLTVENTALKLL